MIWGARHVDSETHNRTLRGDLCWCFDHACAGQCEVSGTVTDPNGAAVPGASVKLINQATKIESATTSNEDGYFNFVNVNPAMYTLRVEVQGFKGVQSAPFDVGVNEAVTQNVALTIGAVITAVLRAAL